MATDDVIITSPAIGITARILFTLIFFLSGITHFTSMQSYIDLMPAPIPFRAFWVVISGVVELVGAAMILFNYRPRLGAWLIVMFLVPVTIVVHGTAMIMLPDQVMRAVNVSMFLKGLAMIACALSSSLSSASPPLREPVDALYTHPPIQITRPIIFTLDTTIDSYFGSPCLVPEKFPRSVLAAKITSMPGTAAISFALATPSGVSIMITTTMLSFIV